MIMHSKSSKKSRFDVLHSRSKRSKRSRSSTLTI